LKIQSTVISNLSKLLPAILIYALLAFVVLLLGRLQTYGIISTAWFLFVLAWLLFAGGGLVLGLLRLFRVFTNTQSRLYAFVAIANLGNSLIAAIFYFHPDPTTNATLFWLFVGITFCLASLMLIDILF
jgi:hypothetical protein